MFDLSLRNSNVQKTQQNPNIYSVFRRKPFHAVPVSYCGFSSLVLFRHFSKFLTPIIVTQKKLEPWWGGFFFILAYLLINKRNQIKLCVISLADWISVDVGFCVNLVAVGCGSGAIVPRVCSHTSVFSFLPSGRYCSCEKFQISPSLNYTSEVELYKHWLPTQS